MQTTLLNRRYFSVAALAAAPIMLAVTNDQILSKKELNELVSNAKTAADMLRLAAHYHAVAAKHEAEAVEHTQLAAKYKANPTVSEVKRPNAPDTASHCLTYAEHCRKAAQDMHEMAAMHEEMAKSVK